MKKLFVILTILHSANFIFAQNKDRQNNGCFGFSVSPNYKTLSADSTKDFVFVSNPGGCTWSTSPNVSWITITYTSFGSGGDTVHFSIQMNSGSSRSGFIAFPTVEGPTDTIFITQQGVLGMNKLQILNYKFQISPNPLSDNTVLQITNISEFTMGQWGIKLYDLFGREVYKQPILNPKSQTINPNLPCGVYFYKIINDKEVISIGKLVIQ